jgi:chromosome segregation ATPase
MSDIDVQKYNFYYLKHLESFSENQVKRYIDAEVRLSLVSEALTEEKKNYEESQKQVEVQNNMMQQAARSIEDLSIQNKEYESTNKDYIKRIGELETSMNGILENDRALRELMVQKDAKIKDLESEVNRRNEELQVMYDDYTKLKELVPQAEAKKLINKNKKSVEDGTF